MLRSRGACWIEVVEALGGLDECVVAEIEEMKKQPMRVTEG